MPTENLCPGKTAAVVVQSRGEAPAQLATKYWGLVPGFDKSTSAKPDFWRMFNARSEGLKTSPVFRRLLDHGRCAVPLDGFFEWTADELQRTAPKQPWYVYRRSGGPLWIAGLHDHTTRPDGTTLDTFTLITRDVCDELSWLHDRMPILLDAEGLAAWLGPPTADTHANAAETHTDAAETHTDAALTPSTAAPGSSIKAEPAPASGAGRVASAVLAALEQTIAASELAWHPTTKKMSKLEYQAPDCAAAVPLPSQQQRSVAALFTAAATAAATPSNAPTSGETKPRAAAKSTADSKHTARSPAPTAAASRVPVPLAAACGPTLGASALGAGQAGRRGGPPTAASSPLLSLFAKASAHKAKRATPDDGGDAPYVPPSGGTSQLAAAVGGEAVDGCACAAEADAAAVSALREVLPALDVAGATRLLHASGWRVDAAVARFYDGGGDDDGGAKRVKRE